MASAIARAREFYDVVTGLWDSLGRRCLRSRRRERHFFDPDKMHVLNHKGEYLKVRGPLNIARPMQGWPVIVQAGASDAGRQLAPRPRRWCLRRRPGRSDGQRLLCRREGPDGEDRPRPRSHEDPARRFMVVGDLDRRSDGEACACSTAWCTTTAASPRSRSRWPRRVGVRSRRAAAGDPGDQRKQERPRAGRRMGQAREPDDPPARQRAWRLFGPGVDRHAADDRRPDGAMAGEEGSDGFNVMFPYLPGASTTSSTRSCPSCRQEAFSARIRGRDPARESWFAAAGEPVFQGVSGALVIAGLMPGRDAVRRLLWSVKTILEATRASITVGASPAGPALMPRQRSSPFAIKPHVWEADQ